ncbi:MAG: hypothetical protein JJE40_10930, partial [Vicinamibacteria bacterium]|nr:hypothetical protein [Vicinamibacteria bacterium]
MADRARQATEVRSRILVYSELIQSCGTCHALHGNVWGPDNASVAAPSSYQPRLGAFVRLNQAQPILSPQGNGFETGGVFNPAVVKDGNRFVMLYRAQDRQGISRLGYATSTDGVMFTREAAPVLSPEAEYEHGGGVEDPRLVQIDGLY